MQRKDSNRNETAAFIGFGMSGVSEFCSYVRAAVENKQRSKIIIFEKNKHQFATGEPFRLDTSTLWLLNGPAADKFRIPVNDNTLYDWIKDNDEFCHEKYGVFDDRYPPRAVIGEYLLSRYEKYKQLALAHGIEVEVRHEEVLHLDVTSDQKFKLGVKSGSVTVDFVGLGLGNLHSDNFHEMKNNPGFINNPWDSHELDQIPKDESEIIIVGGHLTFVDTAKYLALARQYEGRFIVATRSPNMIVARDFDKTVSEAPMLELKEQFAQHRADKLSLQSAYTLFKQAYLQCAKHPVDDSYDTHYALTTQIASYDKSAQLSFSHGDINELCDFMELFVDTGTYYLMWDVLTPEAQEEFAKHYFGRMLAYLAGVPLINARFLKEIYDQGRVIDKSGMTGLLYDAEKREYICSFNDGSEKRARYVVNATGFGHRIDRHLNEHPLLADLLQNGTISMSEYGGIIVNNNNHVLSAENSLLTNLIAVGPSVYKGQPHGESAVFISSKADNAVNEHFRISGR